MLCSTVLSGQLFLLQEEGRGGCCRHCLYRSETPLPALFKGPLSPFVCARHVAFAFFKVALLSTNHNFGGSVWPLAIFVLKNSTCTTPGALLRYPPRTALNRALKSTRPSLPAGRTPAPRHYLAAAAPCRSRGASLSCSTALPKDTNPSGQDSGRQ